MSVRVEGAHKRFGHVAALADVTLEAPSGAILAIVGPSGCGKTTLLRVIAGLERSDAGRVFVRGRDVTALAPERRGVGMVFQNYALFPHMSVAANVSYGLKRQGVGKKERRERVRALLSLMDLEGMERRLPHQLSAGQMQRVAIARALAPEPQALLLDEPLSALDAMLRVRLREEIRALQKRLGITTIVVTHDQEEALTMADAVAVMNAGRIEQLDDPWSLYDRPGTPFVAEFIGRSNRFLGVADEEGATLEGLGRVPRAALPPELVGEVMAVVRPDAVLVEGADAVDAAVQDEAIFLRVEVQDALFGGERCQLVLAWEGKRVLASAPAHRYADFQAAIGQARRAWIPHARIRWVKNAP